jgi:quercetin dioxygenase-like cupin family protein
MNKKLYAARMYSVSLSSDGCKTSKERNAAMMTITSSIRTVAKQTLQCTALVGTMLVLGQIALAEDDISVVMKQRLADMAGKEATVLIVDYAPGAASEVHAHPGSVFAYVLEGTILSQLDGEEPTTYAKGQSWYESPKKPHVVSKNASETHPAKLLVFLLSQEGESIKVNSADSGR